MTIWLERALPVPDVFARAAKRAIRSFRRELQYEA
jgi:hypothetical protein